MSFRSPKQLVLVLDNIRSMYNVGAIFRLADGLGVAKLYLCGITPAPPRKEIHKTALGTETRVSWEKVSDIAALISKLKGDGFLVAALELTPTAIPIQSFSQTPLKSLYPPTAPLALIVGHETEGVGKSALKLANVHLKIPMQGSANSLNVATACAIAVWHLTQSRAKMQ